MNDFLKGLNKVLFGVAGLAFLWGGRALHEFAGVDRTFAEMEGIGLAVVLGMFGLVAKHFGEEMSQE